MTNPTHYCNAPAHQPAPEANEICEGCGRPIESEEIELGWPIAIPDLDSDDPTQNSIYVCSDCYGD